MFLSVIHCVSFFLVFQPILGEEECNTNPLFCDKHAKYRKVDGSCNNLETPYLGKYNRPYKRFIPNSFADGKYSLTKMLSGEPLPSARIISNLLFPSGNKNHKSFTLSLIEMGQMVAHDLSFNGPDDNDIGCCISGNRPGSQCRTNDKCADVNIPLNDPDYNITGWKCLKFIRTKTASQLGCPTKNRDGKISTVTSFLDLSVIYGNNEEDLAELRTNKEGQLKVKTKNGYDYPIDAKDINKICPRIKSKNEPCYLVGDERINQNPQLTSLHIVFYNEHNRIAKGLAALNHKWNDERLFQEARKINVAQYQHIVFNEILLWFIGGSHMADNALFYPEADSCVDDYDSYNDPSISVEFATAAYRTFHSLLVAKLQLYNEHRKQVGEAVLNDYVWRPIIQELNSTYNIHNLLRGMTVQPHAAIMAHDFKYKFENFTEIFGYDLVSIDIQRNRDHGVGRYLEAREWCGLSTPRSWDDLTKVINLNDVKTLKILYNTPADIELYVGGSLEDKVLGSMVGETFLCIIKKQFYNLRTSDRFFYENCESNKFSPVQLRSIKKSSLAKVICDNSKMYTIQARVTEIVDATNSVVKCRSLPRVNLKLWKD